MAVTLRLVTSREFRTSRYGQLADQIDGDLDEIIAQAEAHVEHHLDRTISVTEYTERHRPSTNILFLRERPVVSLSSIKRRRDHHAAWETLNIADFERMSDGGPGTVRSLDDAVAGYEIEIVYSAGYTPVPWDIKSAVLLQTAIFAYTDLEMYGQGDSKEPGIGYLQEQVYELLKPFRKRRVF